MRFTIAVLFLFAGLAHAQGHQLLLIQRVSATSPTAELSECIDVNTTGAFRYERTPVDSGQPGPSKIRVGTLTFEQRGHLNDLLNDPAVLSLSRPVAAKRIPPGGEIWQISIYRGDHQQVLHFANSSTQNPELSVRGGAKSIYNTLAMKQLLDWYQQMTKRKLDDVDKTATPTCSLSLLPHH